MKFKNIALIACLAVGGSIMARTPFGAIKEKVKAAEEKVTGHVSQKVAVQILRGLPARDLEVIQNLARKFKENYVPFPISDATINEALMKKQGGHFGF